MIKENCSDLLILGIGNLLLQDEGAGVRVIEEFEKIYQKIEGVEILDGGTSGIELLQYIQGKKYLILVDVVNSGNAPGTIIRLEDTEVPAFFQKKISPHQLGISDLLASAQLIDKMPDKVVLFGIEPKLIDVGLELSDEVRTKILPLVDTIAAELQSLGFELVKKTTNSASVPEENRLSHHEQDKQFYVLE